MADFKEVFRDISRGIQRLPETFFLLLKGKEGQIGLRALSLLRTEPGKPIYPLRWKSKKQRRAFFATKGFGKGIPYSRSGAQSNSWSVIVEDGKIVLSSSSPVTRFIQGEDVQPFHLDTGWIQVSDVVDDFLRDGIAVTVETWNDAVDEALL
jgi:hypothetical protein